MSQRVLIMGGTGVFGKRLARHLARFEGIELFVSSRTAAKAEQFVATLKADMPALCAHGIDLDHQKNLKEQLEVIKPFAVIDCSGPFQSATYEAPRVIISSGAHLIDLADARNYLANFASNLDDLAQKYGVSALTGASSTPTLSSCVVEHITQGWSRVDTIDICITPGGKSEVGRSVIEAILNYAGRDIPFWRQGRLSSAIGWTKSQVVYIPKLGPRRVAPVETYDAEYLGPRHDVQSRVSFSAGLESSIEQFGIGAIAILRKHNLLPNFVPLVPMLMWVRRITRIPTSDRGGMLVQVTGVNADGNFVQAKWSLVATDDHGPFIPILPAAAALQRLLEGNVIAGASLANQQINLSDILAQMTPYQITTETEVTVKEQSLFAAALGAEVFCELPPAVQRFHHHSAPALWAGEAEIVSGKGLMSKAIAWAFGFPSTGKVVEVTVGVDRTVSVTGAPSERWNRTFAGKPMSSVLRKEIDGTFTEYFAPFTFILGLSREADGLKMPVLGWRFGRLPLPRALAPRSDTTEFEDEEGRFRFDVRLTLPIVGLLAHYKGWLVPTSK